MDTLENKNKWLPAKVIGGYPKYEFQDNDGMTYKISIDGIKEIFFYISKKDNVLEKGMNVLVKIGEDGYIKKIKTAWDFSKITAVKLFLIRQLLIIVLIYVILTIYLGTIDTDFIILSSLFGILFSLNILSECTTTNKGRIRGIFIIFIGIVLSLLAFTFGSKIISGKSQEMVYLQSQNMLVEKIKIPYIDIAQRKIPEYTIVSIADKVYEKETLEFILDDVEYEMDVNISRPTTYNVLNKMKKNPADYFNKISVKKIDLYESNPTDSLINLIIQKAGLQVKWHEHSIPPFTETLYEKKKYNSLEYVKDSYKIILKHIWPKDINTKFDELKITFSDIRKIEKV